MRSRSIAISTILLSATIVVGCASTQKHAGGVSLTTLDTAPLADETATLKVFGFGCLL